MGTGASVHNFVTTFQKFSRPTDIDLIVEMGMQFPFSTTVIKYLASEIKKSAYPQREKMLRFLASHKKHIDNHRDKIQEHGGGDIDKYILRRAYYNLFESNVHEFKKRTAETEQKELEALLRDNFDESERTISLLRTRPPEIKATLEDVLEILDPDGDESDDNETKSDDDVVVFHPPQRSVKKASAKKPSAKKASAKKPSAKKVSTKKPSAKKPSAKKISTKKPSAKKVSTKKPSAKKASSKKVSTKKPSAKKVSTKKPSAKKASSKKVSTKKPSAKKASSKKTRRMCVSEKVGKGLQLISKKGIVHFLKDDTGVGGQEAIYQNVNQHLREWLMLILNSLVMTREKCSTTSISFVHMYNTLSLNVAPQFLAKINERTNDDAKCDFHVKQNVLKALVKETTNASKVEKKVYLFLSHAASAHVVDMLGKLKSIKM